MIGIGLGALVAGSAKAASSVAADASDPYYQIESVVVQEVTGTAQDPFLDVKDVSPLYSSSVENSTEAVSLSTMINTGRQIWAIVEANKPVVNIQMNHADALPEGVKGWESLQNWSAPHSHTYRVSYKNLYGMTVVDFSFRLTYSYGGNIKGVGRYLANVSITTANVSVLWGYTFNAKVNIPNVLNVGSSASPVAGMEIQVKWSTDTVIKHSETSANFSLNGAGAFKML